MSRIIPFALLSCALLTRVHAQEAGAAASPPAEQPAAAPPAQQPTAAPGQAPPQAAAAKQTFDGLVEKWTNLIGEIKKAEQARAAAQGDDHAKLDAQVANQRKEADDLLAKITDAGLAVYRADAKAYPEINNTLLYIAQYHLAGNAQGDGGDQYEKALPLIKSLIDAGAAQQWPELWVWGAVAAYATNDFATAKDYFTKANDAGVLDGPKGDTPADPRIWETAQQFHAGLDRAAAGWEKEKAIRAAEEKANDLPRVKFTTTRGDIVLELFENEAPQAVGNFLELVKKGYYNGVVFHRVLPAFMAQGGDPQGTGQGGPGYTIRDEVDNPNYRHHFRGSLSMAKTQAPNSGGSQFFLCYVPTSFLDGKHTVFGRIIEGMDVAAGLKRVDPDSPNRSTPDRIVKAEVLRDRGHEYKFEKLPE
jgi:cyclophilin family peptidyl-prolyl cis-trans isomerase